MPPFFAQTKDCNGTVESPCIVIDNGCASESANALRSAQQISDYPEVSHIGVNQLTLSASAAPSLSAWQEIKEFISRQQHIKRIIVIDLRQETHAYVNGRNLTLATKNNWVNQGKNTQEILNLEQQWIETLRAQGTITNLLLSKQLQQQQFESGQDLLIETIASEQQIVAQFDIHYVRLPVQDHCAPGDEIIDEFIKLVANLEQDAWIHLHCRGGKGRASSFMMMFDCLKNADKLSFDELMQRQKAIPPNYDLSFIKKDKPELIPGYEKRYAFIQEFYQFAKARLAGDVDLWTQWQQQINQKQSSFYHG